MDALNSVFGYGSKNSKSVRIALDPFPSYRTEGSVIQAVHSPRAIPGNEGPSIVRKDCTSFMETGHRT